MEHEVGQSGPRCVVVRRRTRNWNLEGGRAVQTQIARGRQPQTAENDQSSARMKARTA